MKRSLICILVLLMSTSGVHAASHQSICGTPEPDIPLAKALDLEARIAVDAKVAKNYQIPIAFHIITDGKKGQVALGQIEALVHNLSVSFQGTPFSFYLFRVDKLNKKPWFNNCGPGSKNERQMMKRLAIDPAHVINIYSCNPLLPGLPPGLTVIGYASFPHLYPENSYLHGIRLHPTVLPGGGSPDYGQYGLVGVHEMGHYLGLFHTFQGGCADEDLVADTPAQEAAHFACPVGIDTCSDAAGPDDTRNFMNYSGDSCMEHFTPLQVERMIVQTGYFRHSL